MAIFNPNRQTVVYTDASVEGIAAVMKQRQDDNTFKPVSYFSKKINSFYKRTKKALFLECLAIKEALNYWRYRLLGIKFSIITDHKPLLNVQIKTKFDDELRELLLSISQFDFEIQYQPGKSNIEADCLSRNPVLDSHEATSELKVLNFVTIEDILNDQRNFSPPSSINVISDGNKLLYNKKNSKLIISDNFLPDIIQKAHHFYGHIGIKQMELTLCPKIFNVKLKSQIKKYVQNCSVCIRNKTRLSPTFGHMSQLGPATKPFQYMSLDTIGGLAGNNCTHNYIHLLVDHFSRFAYFITSSTQKANDFIKLLNIVISRNNHIKNLLTDQYGGLTSNTFKQYLLQNNVNLFYTAVDCPFSNGLNERLNQTLINRLRCKINENNVNKNRSWPTLFKECVNEYNNTVHTVTRFSPSYLLHGVSSLSSPFDLFPSVSSLEQDRKIAFNRSQAQHIRNKKYFDKNKKFSTFQKNDLVYVLHGNILNRNKLDEIRTGPYKIVDKLSNSLFRVAAGFQKAESNVFHASKLYPFASS